MLLIGLAIGRTARVIAGEHAMRITRLATDTPGEALYAFDGPVTWHVNGAALPRRLWVRREVWVSVSLCGRPAWIRRPGRVHSNKLIFDIPPDWTVVRDQPDDRPREGESEGESESEVAA